MREELLGAIRDFNEDERARLVALAWLGRGTFELGEWKEAVATARSEHARRTAEYLLGMPLLGDYLEDGLAPVRRRNRGRQRYARGPQCRE